MIHLKDELAYIGSKVIESQYILSEKTFLLLKKFYTEENLNIYTDSDKENNNKWNSKFFSIIGATLKGDNIEENELANWAKTTGETLVRNHIPLSVSLRSFSIFRNVIWHVFTEELEQKSFAAITMLDVGKLIDPLLDEISAIIGHVYEEHNRNLMKIAYTALEELSVPVVPVAKETAIIPLIGAIDTDRSQLILEVALEEAAKLRVEYLILDISGVPIVDTMVADNLFKVVQALDLIGVKTIISGIRPEIAQTVISLGINFHKITTCANLQTALASIGLKRVQD
ncbi:STAS domain-containing protein [Niallia sp. NCCP-28]|uniref:STAS domain-containing protein n=1 Tax=Niallia sp. NCCP-28 TaxID=2934712 RepID=UPI0020BE031B|nr:STAS domain-containing protein [Niallia sp. NCCP-28]